MERSSYANRRVERMLQLLDPRFTTEQQLDALSQFVEQETADAYRRGTRGRGGFRSRRVGRGAGESQEPRERARRTSAGAPLNYRSAVQAGVIKRLDAKPLRRSQCCDAPMIGGVQCEACGSDGIVERTDTAQQEGGR